MVNIFEWEFWIKNMEAIDLMVDMRILIGK